MTAQTSDRAQRIEKITKAITAWEGTRADDTMLATVLVDTLAPDTERLGGGEREVHECRKCGTMTEAGQVHPCPSEHGSVWNAMRHYFDVAFQRGNEIMELREQLNTLAQTAKDATARAEAAEAANMELDKERRSSDQSARDLRAENARLRAKLDAMTGEQVPYMVHVNALGQQIQLYRHPSPAARVVGACVVDANGDVTTEWMTGRLTIAECVEAAERNAYATKRNVHKLAIVGPALTPNADGAK